MRRIATLLVVAATATAGPVASPAVAAAKRSVPRGFVGTDADGPLLADDTSLFTTQLGSMVKAGVESVRMTFDWRRIQPYRTIDDVPLDDRASYRVVDGVPTRFGLTDRWVTQAARRGLTVMPVLMYAPRWASRHPSSAASPPKDFADYARFAATMAGRYGTGGSFWSEYSGVPLLPIDDYQVWNEPHFKGYWSDQPWAPDYVGLLKRAYAAIHDADPWASVVLAGLTNRSWDSLEEIYRAGGRPYFDYVAIHPFTAKVGGVVTILDRARAVMKRHGDSGRPLLVTELSWTSARGKTTHTYGFEQDEKGQAKQLAAAYRLLAKERKRLKLRAAYWYTWLTMDRSTVQPFDYAGVTRLEQGSVVKKPAYRAMRTTAVPLEGCSSKSGNARAC